MELKVEIRSDCVVLDGYVNAVARDSRIMLDEYNNKFVEQITPGTFTRALQLATNIDCLLNHNESRKLASTSEGTLELYEDNIGLRANVTIRDSEVIEKAKKKLLRGWSFGFIAHQEHEEYTDSFKRKFIDDLELFEVSIIDDTLLPCYIRNFN